MFALVRPASKKDWPVGICNVDVIYNGNIQIFTRVYGVLAMLLLVSTILLYSFALNNVRKRYMKTFAFQMERVQSDAGNVEASDPSNLNHISESRKRKVLDSLKVVGIVVLLLVLFTGPFVMLVFMSVFGFQPSPTSAFAVSLLASINSVLNPFVYCWKIDSVRKEFKLVFRFCVRD
jgi:hypothetical protein